MLIDRAALTPGQTLQADLVIVGGGVAGITLARRFANSKTSVLLLEGGGFSATERSQSLYEMEMVTRHSGMDREEVYATRERLRFFGGTSNHWSGWCRPLESWDFEERSWVENSGWPVGFDELKPWYVKAQDHLGLHAFDDQVGPSQGGGKRVFDVDGADFESRTFHFAPESARRFRMHKDELVAAPNVRLLVEANVLRLHADESRSTVTHASVQVEDGPAITVRGTRFVLATGGLENPRVLLLSEEQSPGAFNRHDLVGRYFMEHPHDSTAGWLVFVRGKRREALENLYMRRPRVKGSEMNEMNVWMPSRACQEREKLLNVTLQIRQPKRVKLDDLGKAVQTTNQALYGWDHDAGGEQVQKVRVWTRSENAPRADSRVFLGDDVDRLGLRKAKIDWKLGEAESRSIRRTFELWAAAFAATSRGRARIRIDPDKPFGHTWGGAHHMGTTRMAADPKAGVVDADCKLHGLDNLWVGGSSVYTTSGVANPTFTLMALALRLGEHLAGEIQ